MEKTYLKNQELFKELNKYDKDSSEYKRLEQEIVKNNMPLVANIAKKYFNNCSYDEGQDIFSVASLGLLKAVRSYNISKNFLFATYATRCIENEILMYCRKLKKNSLVVSLSTVLAYDRDGNELQIEDILQSEEDIEEDVISKDENLQKRRDLKEIIDKLPPKQKLVLKKKYLSGFDVTKQKAIAKFLGFSQSYVSRIEAQAIHNSQLLAKNPDAKLIGETENLPKELVQEGKYKEVKAQLKNIIKTKLPEKNALVLLELYYSSDRVSQRKAAKTLGISSTTVSVANLDGLKLLQTEYKKSHPAIIYSVEEIKSILSYRPEEWE